MAQAAPEIHPATMLSSSSLLNQASFRELMQSHAPTCSSSSLHAQLLLLFRCAKALEQAGWQELALVTHSLSSSDSTSALSGRFLFRGCSDKLRRAQAASQSSTTNEEFAEVAAMADVDANTATTLHRTESSDEPDLAAAPVLLEPARLTQFQYVLPMSSHENITQSLITSMYSAFDVDSFLLAIFSPPSMFSFFPFYQNNFHMLPRSLLQKHEGEADGENAEDEALLDEDDNGRNNSGRSNKNNDLRKNQRKANRENKKQKRKQETQLQAADAKRHAASPSPTSTPIDPHSNQPSIPATAADITASSAAEPGPTPSTSLAAPVVASGQTNASASANARRPRRARHAE